MNTEEAANTMVNYYTSVTPVLRGQPIYIQFSNHKELKTDSSPNQAVRALGCGRRGVGWAVALGLMGLTALPPQRAQAALQAVNSVQSGNLALAASAAAVDAGMAMAGQSPVLRIDPGVGLCKRPGQQGYPQGCELQGRGTQLLGAAAQDS